ncbi:MAG: hypothetical protein OEO21_10895 [Candidatus Krumholzibacteria bacterium]|nr:hypothetical protein [Candidatus Krumholzibacteria bacterium]
MNLDGLWHALGELHPAIVHFPVALVITAFAAEMLVIVRKRGWYADAARFMIVAGAVTAVPAALAGLAAASTEEIAPALAGAFAAHRAAGLVTPALAVLAAGLGESTRRSGQVWEQILYRVVLALAAAGAVVAAVAGGMLVHGEGGS